MKFESKFDIGNTLFTMRDSRIVEVDVVGITIQTYNNGGSAYAHYKVSHFLYDMFEEFEVGEDDLFVTKEELVEELLNRSNNSSNKFILGDYSFPDIDL
jgi:hypothetical protein